MAFIIDNILYILSMTMHIGKKKDFAYPSEKKVSPEMVTVLIPAKNETYEAMKHTVENIIKQTIVPEIWILLDEKDSKTILNAKRLEEEYKNVMVLYYPNKSKADAINKIIEYIDTKYILLIDVGDIFENNDAIENLLKVAETYNSDAVVSITKAQQTKKWWQKIVNFEMNFWTTNTLRIIKNRFGFIPLPGTGLLLRTSTLKQHPFPETLTEDGSLGLYIRNVVITPTSVLLYNLPSKLQAHLKQRARWIAGFLQTVKIAKGKEKIVYLIPSIQGLVPISWILTILTYLIIPSFQTPFIIDLITFALLWYLIIKVALNSKSPIALLVPFWWFVAGLSFYKSLQYFKQNKWYFSPKEVEIYE